MYDNYPDFVKDGRRYLIANEFLIYWPLVSGYLCANEKSTIFRKCLKGTSQKTLLALMKSLGIKGFDEGKSLPINKHGNPMFRK